FGQSIRSTIEHGPTGNKFLADYTSVVFLYSDTRPHGAGVALPPLAARRVSDPASVVYTPGWNTPIHAFSWSNAALSKHSEKINGEELRYLSLKAEGREVFGPHYLSFVAEMPLAGKYKISIEAVAGPSQGIVQLFRQEAPVGSTADLYSAEKRKSAVIDMGVVEMEEGDNHLFFKVVGRNARSSGLGFDIYRIICERIG
ncbi:MAG: hypothetical protein ACRD68_17660, partial [Pyrinomonadaceae bacterium]